LTFIQERGVAKEKPVSAVEEWRWEGRVRLGGLGILNWVSSMAISPSRSGRGRTGSKRETRSIRGGGRLRVAFTKRADLKEGRKPYDELRSDGWDGWDGWG
jgi:hypothetical protein